MSFGDRLRGIVFPVLDENEVARLNIVLRAKDMLIGSAPMTRLGKIIMDDMGESPPDMLDQLDQLGSTPGGNSSESKPGG